MSNRKRQLFEELTLEVRASQSATDRFDQAVADALGLNRTDMRCLDIIDRRGRLSGPEHALHELHRLRHGAELVGIGDAAGQDEPVIAGRVGIGDRMINGELLALVEMLVSLR